MSDASHQVDDHSSPGLKATGYSGHTNKKYKEIRKNQKAQSKRISNSVNTAVIAQAIRSRK